ncbi:MAG TPA: hypothetical protein VH274_00380 [Mycobacteriales bacterium]|jgi:hypothetical protein|nr:hypothetical protein [Mycobacteriales bacterium]
MRRVVAALTSGELITFEDGMTPDGILSRRRFEREPDGHVSVYSEHVVTRPDGTDEIIATFRPARFRPDQLVSIDVQDD